MTFVPSAEQLDAAYVWAEMHVPNETCGVFANNVFFPIKNLVDDWRGKVSFLMDPVEYMRVEQLHTIDAIVHSHVNMTSAASDQDRTSCEKLGLPFVIVAVPHRAHSIIHPCGFRAPLVGRSWGYGTHDCYSLVKDALFDYAGITLDEFSREDWEWWKRGYDLIASQFQEAGFTRLPQGTKPQHLDIFGMQVASRVVNHLGVFLEPDVLLHQLQERLSVREPYGGTYQRATVLHLRHNSLIEQRVIAA